MRVSPQFFIAATLCLSFAGCGGSGPVGTVSGKVTTKDGQPVAGQVSFNSENATASGRTDASTGAYRLFSGETEQVAAGTYRVAVTPIAKGPDASSADYAAMMSGQAKPASGGAGSIPEKYKNFSSSGLQFTVAPGSNNFDIVLE